MKSKKLIFKIIPPCHQDSSLLNTFSVDFYLEEDAFGEDDYDTTYYLHASDKITGSTNKCLGVISIEKIGQKQKEKRMLRKYLPNKVFTNLPAQFVSISFSVELIMALDRYLNSEMKSIFVRALHLITGKESPYYLLAKNDVCFNTAALRGSSMDSDVLSIAKHYLEGEHLINVMERPLTIHLNGFEPFSFGFNPSPISDPDFPNRIIAFIGKNGTGKSTAIYKIAKILYASPEDRRKIKTAVGFVEPNDAAFTRLLVVSYSSFDNFIFPGINKDGYEQLLSAEGSRRFRHIGVRHLYEESSPYIEHDDGSISYLLQDRTNDCSLKSISFLAGEVEAYYDSIKVDEIRERLLKRIHQDLKKNNPILCSVLSDVLDDPLKVFRGLSTGHKFFIHSLLGIMASIEQGSLVLFDEPENHMHPPMISDTIKYIRWILDGFGSYMFVATHSPVVVQELFAQNVYVVRRFGSQCSVSHPREIETYGESLGIINSEVFDLTTGVTSYHRLFDRLYEMWGCDQLENADMVINVFQEKLREALFNKKDATDNPILSNQMIMYLIGKKLS